MARSTTGVHQGHQAHERFGQNFLVNNGVIHAIVVVIDLKPDGVFVEIGPGLGVLTVPLMGHARTLQVVGLDRDLVAHLQQRFGDRLTVHAGDALAFDFGPLQEVGRPLCIVDNLSYNIPSPLPFHLATFADHVHDQHFILQKEAVDRMVAALGNKVFSWLSVMLQVQYHMELVLDVLPGSFNPPPKADSAAARMIPRPADKSPYTPVNLRAPSTVVMMAFSQRRKVLRNTLGALRDVIDLEAFGFDLGWRVEEVPVEDFVVVVNALSANHIAGSASDLSED